MWHKVMLVVRRSHGKRKSLHREVVPRRDCTWASLEKHSKDWSKEAALKLTNEHFEGIHWWNYLHKVRDDQGTNSWVHLRAVVPEMSRRWWKKFDVQEASDLDQISEKNGQTYSIWKEDVKSKPDIRGELDLGGDPSRNVGSWAVAARSKQSMVVIGLQR